MTGARRVLVLVLGAFLVAAAWLVTAPTAPPLYDGLPMPADPYRYLDPPPGYANPGAPLTVHEQMQVVGGFNPYVDLRSSEYPPQAELQLPQNSLSAAGIPAVSQIVFSLRAVPDPRVLLPSGTQFHGNVYRVAASAAGRPVGLAAGQHAVVLLRQPRLSQSSPQLALLQDGHWRLLPTQQQNGGSELIATVPALGEVTILEHVGGSGGGSPVLEICVLLAGLLLFGAAVGGVRLSRR